MRTLSYLLGFCLLMMFAVSPAFGQSTTLKVGDKAPRFQAKADNGNVWKSTDVVGKKLLVVYFYPAAMTGGCTKQACAFRDNRTKLTSMGAEVVGVSGDDVEGLKLFKRSQRLNFPLLSDADGKIAKMFGVPVREGGTFKTQVDGKDVELKRGVTTGRWTFVVDRKGKIVYMNSEVNPEKDSQEVIAAIEKLQQGNRM